MYDDSINNLAESGAKKAHLLKARLFAFLVGSAMAGAYIGFGDMVMFTAGAHVDPAWSHLLTGMVFSSALTIVVFAGSELFTGTAMYMPLALLAKKTGVTGVIAVWSAAWIGNFIGALLLAALIHAAGGGVPLGDGSGTFYTIVAAKMTGSSPELLARGALCNWLVCLAIWMATRTDSAPAKIILIFWPITIFVACGFEHSVANMFTFSLALLGDHPVNVTLAGAAHNLVWVTIGNLFGGAVFVALGYWVQISERGHVPRSSASAAAARRAPPSIK